MADLFGRDQQSIKTPLTADRATLRWDGEIVTSALNFTITYAQQVQRRRTIGNRDAIIITSQPLGSITIQRLLTTDASDLFSKKGWKACEGPATIAIQLGGGCGDTASANSGFGLVATGCIVSQYSIQGEAEGLTVLDNVVIEFLQLSQN